MASSQTSSPSSSQAERDARQRAFRMADQFMSPFCPGLLLSSCQSQGAHDLREEIASRLVAGEAETTITADLVRRFGPGILGAPEARGLGAVAWSTPAAVAVGSLAVLVVALMRLRRRVRPAVEDEPPNPGLVDDERLDYELDALD